MLNLIIAVDKGWGIGKNNDLLFHFSSDLKRFKEFTTNNIVVMGRKTWESLPKKLPNRTNIVISRSVDLDLDNDPDYIFDSVEPVLKMANETDKEVWVIGGSEIVRMFLPYIDTIALTKVNTVRDADVHVEFMEEHISDFMVYKSTTQKEVDKISNEEFNIEYITLIRTANF
jgi:dihydrofolate reductase